MASTITTLKHLQIPLEEVVKATNNFDEEYVIGGGDFGKVYRGQLLVSGVMMNIAARRRDPKHSGGGVEFWTEISVLSSLKHENILCLIGFCDENGEKIIIHKDEATKGSLYMYLSDPTALTWTQRLNICVGIARALEYIHNGEGQGYSVIHRNINSSTVLLDENWEVKLSGFEYSIQHSVNRMHQVFLPEPVGTTGYMDPSILMTGAVSQKSDIYSFGVVLCEILCGRKAFIPDADSRFVAFLFRFHYEHKFLNRIIHPDLRHQMTHKSLTGFCNVAYSCTEENRVPRPKMNNILIKLEKALESETLMKNLKHLKVPLGDLYLATENLSSTYHVRDSEFASTFRAELDHIDEENPSIEEGKSRCELPKRRSNVLITCYPPREDPKTGVDLGEDMFYMGIKILDTYRHPCIAKLLGFFDEGPEMMLVLEYLPNGFLDDCLRNTYMKHTHLTWAKRLKICLDVANALSYIHSETEDKMTIRHCDIKSANILLNEDWGAKLIDFEFSMLGPADQVDQALYLKTFGSPYHYMDPKFIWIDKLQRASDVHSFGILLLEILCGRLAYDPMFMKQEDLFAAQSCFHDVTMLMEIIDPIFKEESGENSFILKKGINKYSLLKFAKVAYKCVTKSQDPYLTMKVIIQELQEALFFQEEQSDMSHVVDDAENLIELKLMHEENSEDKTQRPDMAQDVDEVQNLMEIKLRNADLIKKLEHLKIPLNDIMLATQNFSNVCHIRDCIYRAELDHFDEAKSFMKEGKNKGELPRRRSKAIIYRFYPKDAGFFYTEIKMHDICKHPGIGKLLGFCDEGTEMIVVFEYLSNEYLYDYLLQNPKKPILKWDQRLKICLDVANALNYLHTEMEDQQRVVHRFIQNKAIALDENWGAKIVELNSSVLLPPNEVDGAPYDVSDPFIYMAPECWKTYKAKREVDVYSFGLLLFEVLCGRLADDSIYTKESNDFGLAFVARRCYREGIIAEMIDPILMEEIDEANYIIKLGPNTDSLEKFVKIAHQCVAEIQDQRPTMKVVIKELREALKLQYNDTLKMSLHQIKLATENFDDKNHIGRGGFGKVYRGKVPQGDGYIVAKRLDTRHGQGEKEFRNELQILSKFKHENIISLVGYCKEKDEKDEKVIVYEYVSRGSLDRYLKDASLTWMKRLNICIDVATALAFLHGGAGKQAIVIHRDIKTANILLNDEWNAKLADFGLSLISPINQGTGYVIDHACGTLGYLDPLYLKSNFLTIESDIYSFGVVLFEILCGRSTFEILKVKGQHLPGFIKESFDKGKHGDLVFEALKEHIMPEALTTFQKIAYQCLHDDRDKRPTAKEVLQQLKEAREFQISGSIEAATNHMEVQLNI